MVTAEPRSLNMSSASMASICVLRAWVWETTASMVCCEIETIDCFCLLFVSVTSAFSELAWCMMTTV